MTDVQAVLSHLNGRQVEAFYVLLVSSAKYTFLPELYDVFGREATIKFLDVFAGCSLRVPKINKLERLAMESSIYVRVERVTPRRRQVVIKALAEEYEVTDDRIRNIYHKTKKKLEKEFGFTAIKKK